MPHPTSCMTNTRHGNKLNKTTINHVRVVNHLFSICKSEEERTATATLMLLFLACESLHAMIDASTNFLVHSQQSLLLMLQTMIAGAVA